MSELIIGFTKEQEDEFFELMRLKPQWNHDQVALVVSAQGPELLRQSLVENYEFQLRLGNFMAAENALLSVATLQMGRAALFDDSLTSKEKVDLIEKVKRVSAPAHGRNAPRHEYKQETLPSAEVVKKQITAQDSDFEQFGSVFSQPLEIDDDDNEEDEDEDSPEESEAE